MSGILPVMGNPSTSHGLVKGLGIRPGKQSFNRDSLCLLDCGLTSRSTMTEGRWRIYGRQDDASGSDKIVFVSSLFREKADAEKERDRMSALPLYKGRSLGVTFISEPPKDPQVTNRRDERDVVGTTVAGG